MPGLYLIKSAAKSAITARNLLADERISRRMRREICRTLIHLLIIPQGKIPNPYRMFGYSVKFLDENDFRFLINEVFGNLSYIFSCKNDNAPRIIDCGSNIGLSVLFFKKLYPKAKITAFEPDPEAFDILSKNVKQNSLQDVVVHQCALTDYDGVIEFHKPPIRKGSLLMSIDAGRVSGTTISVPAKRLAPFICDRVDLLKIDIEGAEEGVLRDLYKSNVFINIDQLYLEYHHHIHHQKDTLSGVLKILENSGFGYQISASQDYWPTKDGFQDISLYAYKRYDL
jgi:FkbM family methyltransferase